MDFKNILKKRLKFAVNQHGYYSKPNFIIIGVEKSGTRGLFDTLSQHSGLCPSFKKEIHYFDDDMLYSRNEFANYYHYFPLPWDVKGRLVFEATPNYIFHPQAAKRIYQFDPNIKLISIVRNPTERALSAWVMHHFLMSPSKHPNFFDSRPFKQAISEEIELIKNGKEDKRNIVKKGLYFQQFTKYYEYFDKKNLLIIGNEDLLTNYEQTLLRIFQFLGVTEEYLPLKKGNVSPKQDFKLEHKNELALLDEYYYPENQKFYNLVGQKFNWD